MAFTRLIENELNLSIRGFHSQFLGVFDDLMMITFLMTILVLIIWYLTMK
jgi:hypothetical protein